VPLFAEYKHKWSDKAKSECSHRKMLYSAIVENISPRKQHWLRSDELSVESTDAPLFTKQKRAPDHQPLMPNRHPDLSSATWPHQSAAN